MEQEQKKTINTLLNIDNFTGEHTGRMGPTIKMTLIACIPLVIYLMFMSKINFFAFLIFELLFVIRVSLYIVGDENKKLRIYLESQVDAYSSTYDLVNITHINEDGLIEYNNNKVCYVIEAYTHTYLDDDELSLEVEDFLGLFNKYMYDLYFYNVVGENSVKGDCTGIKGRDLLAEQRFNFLVEQDEYCDTHSKLYKTCIALRTTRSSWKDLKHDIESALNSSKSRCFRRVKLCNREEVTDIVRRDLFAHIDLENMVLKKYANEEYLGSKVLFYDNPSSRQGIQDEDEVKLNKRRVTEDVE